LNILKKLSDRPLITGLLIYAVYISIFIIPGVFFNHDPSQAGINGIDGALTQMKVQILFTVFFVLIFSALGWWKKVGFVAPNPGGLKFLILPLLYVGLLFAINWSEAANPAAYFQQPGVMTKVLSLFVMILMVGFTEESMYRGILFYGLESKYSPLIAIIGTGIVFGLFHYVNLFIGASLYETDYQVLHAIAAGFMYAALRLRIGAIWVVMFFHGIWDFTVFLMQSFSEKVAVSPATEIEPVRLLITIAPAMLYAAFVYWRWRVWTQNK